MKGIKKLLACLTLSLVATAAFSLGISQFASAAGEETDRILLNAQEQITLGTADTNGVTGTNVFGGTLKYGNTTVFGADTEEWFIDSVDGTKAVVLTFDPINVSECPTMTIRMCVGNWVDADTLLFFGTQKELTAENAVYAEDFAFGNAVRELTFETAKFAGENGTVSSITMLRTKASGQIFWDYIRFDKVQAPVTEITLNENAQIALGTADTNGVTGTEVYGGALKYGNTTVFGADTEEWFVDSVDGTQAIVLTFDPIDANYFQTMTLQMCVGNWVDADTLLFFGTQKELTAENAVYAEDFAFGNAVRELTFETAKFADENGTVSSITFIRTRASGQIFLDYIRFSHEDRPDVPVEPVSLRLQGGDVVAASNPENAEDANVTWATFREHPNLPPYGYVERPAFTTYDKTTLPAFELIEGQTPILKAKNVVQAINVGHVKASDYAQLGITYLFTDWAFGTHSFYLYASGTKTFTDEEGNPVGYAATQNNKGPESKHEIKVNNLASLADEQGYIDYIYILYGSEVNGTGVFSGAQIWLNEINFLLEEDLPKPVVSEEYTTKDISELLPVGDGKAFSLTTAGEEAFGAYTTAVEVRTSAADVITFDFKPEGEKYSAYLLLKAPKDATYKTGGLLFWFAWDNILIGNGLANDYAQMPSSEFPAGTMTQEGETKISVATIPYYLDGVLGGYYLALYLGDGETPVLEKYVSNIDSVLGDYTQLVLQDLGENYGVTLGSASETPTPADTLMAVRVETTGGKDTFTKPRASLTLSHFELDGEEVSDLVVEGDATYNAETRTLTFGSEGKVKVYYTVTNAFGTFRSNELELTYDDGVADESPTEVGGCFSSIGGSLLLSAVLTIAGAAIVAFKKKD